MRPYHADGEKLVDGRHPVGDIRAAMRPHHEDGEKGSPRKWQLTSNDSGRREGSGGEAPI